ncbi:MAG TPA: DUF1801 domain-containing protein [Bacteroidetes bacterium]|nr:DUF1801 domain-containing protein [Bacteroidota bacterium]
MRIQANTVEEYLQNIPEERKPYINKLRKTILDNLPEGFEEQMSYGMPSYVVPHSVYPAGYHAKPKEPLPFISIASQKNHIALYHMGVYSIGTLDKWFRSEYPKHAKYKLNMAKSCVRFTKFDDIPYDLIAELVRKVNVEDWIKEYEKNIKK